jgi:hypothetical protein
MNRQRTNAKTRRTSSHDRRGVVVGLLLVMIIFVTGFMAVGVNAIRLRQVQTQLRNVCRSAALAGAAELLDEGVLNKNPNLSDDVMAARLATCSFAQVNPVDGGFIRLNPNEKNLPLGDVVIGYVDPAGPVGQPIELDERFGVNTVRVTARMSRNASNRVSLWFGNFIGLTTVDVGVSVQASIDQRVIGFRPEPGVKAPVIPMIGEYESWWKQATAAATALNDQYAVDPQSGAVTMGSDGIPEITLVLGSSQATDAEAGATTGRCAPLMLPRDAQAGDAWAVRTREGLSLGDLREYGGMLVIQNGATQVGIEAFVPQELPYALIDSIGMVRAWPLGEPSSTNAASWNLIGFGAGRIVAVKRRDGGGMPTWNLIIQPATLVSSQAVADAAAVSNPWIAKLELTQ